MPLSERRSRLAMRLESKSIRKPQNMDLYNFSKVIGISWNQFCGTIVSTTKRGISRKNLRPRIIGIDDKSYRKGHK